MDRIHTPTAPAAPTVDVPQILTALAAHLLTTPGAHLGNLTVTRAVLDIAGPTVSVTALYPVWDVLPLGGHGDLGYTHTEYAGLLSATANSDAEEALRRVQGRPAPTTKPRQAVAA